MYLPSKNEDLFYDSDPGDNRLAFYNHSHRNNVNYTEGESMVFTSSSEEEYSVNNENSFPFDNSNDDLVSQFIRELINDNITLVWHPSQNHNTSNLSPVCVTAWFEMGSRLKDRVIQPK